MEAQENNQWVVRCSEPRSYKDAIDLLAHASHEIWMRWMYELMGSMAHNIIRQKDFLRFYERTCRPFAWLSDTDQKPFYDHAAFVIALLDMTEEPARIPNGVYPKQHTLLVLQDMLANEIHAQHQRWLTYVLELCWVDPVTNNSVIPMETYERWVRQMDTPFLELSYEEQKSDYMLAYELAECIGLHQEGSV